MRLLLASLIPRVASFAAFRSGEPWLDTHGRVIDAHGAGFLVDVADRQWPLHQHGEALKAILRLPSAASTAQAKAYLEVLWSESSSDTPLWRVRHAFTLALHACAAQPVGRLSYRPCIAPYLHSSSSAPAPIRGQSRSGSPCSPAVPPRFARF